jgi:serine carboxypeptidase-like clade 2
MYSGYITVDQERGRALFYFLIKAETDADKKPLLVWYQGGPGCSGLIGLFMENGPLRVDIGTDAASRVVYNDLGWTRFANVLFVEQPAFVGFSYSNSTADRRTGDDKAAEDNYQFLQRFVTVEFPEFMGRETWFTGESYGGVYVPTLTNLILSNPSGVLYKQTQGFMIGNPVFSCQDGFIGSTGPYFIENVNLLYWHGLASYTNYRNWTLLGCNDPRRAEQSDCQAILKTITKQIGVIDQQKRSIETVSEQQQRKNWPSLDPDNIFQDFCTGNATLAFSNTPLPNVPCPSQLGDLLGSYLNRADVQKALGVKGTIRWSECTDNIDYDITGRNMNPLYETFFKNKPGFKILVYSGDLDILTVPFGYTQPCIAKLSGIPVSAWQPWFVNGATAGYVEEYDKYTFATLKGAGHEAPLYQPLILFQMIYRFLTTGKLNVDGEGRRYYRKRLTQSDMLRKYGLAPNLF